MEAEISNPTNRFFEWLKANFGYFTSLGVAIYFLFFHYISNNDLYVLIILIILLMWNKIDSASIAGIFNLKTRTKKLEKKTEKLEDKVFNLTLMQSNVSVNQKVEINVPSFVSGYEVKKTKAREDADDVKDTETAEYDNKKKEISLFPSKDVIGFAKIQSARDLELGKVHLNSGDYRLAEPYLTSAYNLDPENWIAAMVLGYIYGESHPGLDDLEKAIYFSTIATNLNKTHFNQFLNLGLAQLHTKKKDLLNEAIVNFDKSNDIIEADESNRELIPFREIIGRIDLFKAEAYEKLSFIEKAISFNESGISKLNNLPEPKSLRAKEWLAGAEAYLTRLLESQTQQ